MPASLFSSATLAEFFRFALLLVGDSRAAERILADTLHDGEAQLAEMRHSTARQAWLVHRLRDRCLRDNAANERPVPRLVRSEGDIDPAEILKIEAFIVAQRFSTLPEPQRSALALFYLELFDAEEIARLLKMDTEALARTLADARALLRDAMHATPA